MSRILTALLPLALLGASPFSSTTPGGGLTASSPLAVSGGNVACATCATTTNGGALSGTAPIAVSAGGAVSCSTCVTTATTTGTNTGDVTLAAVGSSPSANAASLSGQQLTLQPADGTHPGCVTSSAQTLGGDKTFTGNILSSGNTTSNIGSPSNEWNHVYTNFLNLDAQGIRGAAASGVINFNLTVTPTGDIADFYNNNTIKISFGSGGQLGVAGGVTYQAQTLDTCSSAIEGRVEWDSSSGANTGHRTRLCLCRSSGSNVYTWQNLAGSSLTDLGTSTTCAD